jgi:hypothetical protein
VVRLIRLCGVVAGLGLGKQLDTRTTRSLFHLSGMPHHYSRSGTKHTKQGGWPGLDDSR